MAAHFTPTLSKRPFLAVCQYVLFISVYIRGFIFKAALGLVTLQYLLSAVNIVIPLISFLFVR